MDSGAQNRYSGKNPRERKAVAVQQQRVHKKRRNERARASNVTWLFDSRPVACDRTGAGGLYSRHDGLRHHGTLAQTRLGAGAGCPAVHFHDPGNAFAYTSVFGVVRHVDRVRPIQPGPRNARLPR